MILTENAQKIRAILIDTLDDKCAEFEHTDVLKALTCVMADTMRDSLLIEELKIEDIEPIVKDICREVVAEAEKVQIVLDKLEGR